MAANALFFYDYASPTDMPTGYTVTGPDGPIVGTATDLAASTDAPTVAQDASGLWSLTYPAPSALRAGVVVGGVTGTAAAPVVDLATIGTPTKPILQLIQGQSYHPDAEKMPLRFDFINDVLGGTYELTIAGAVVATGTATAADRIDVSLTSTQTSALPITSCGRAKYRLKVTTETLVDIVTGKVEVV